MGIVGRGRAGDEEDLGAVPCLPGDPAPLVTGWPVGAGGGHDRAAPSLRAPAGDAVTPLAASADAVGMLVDDAASFLAAVPRPADPAPDDAGGGGRPRPVRVLLPLSGSEHTRRIVDEMIALARVMPTEVRVLHLREYDVCRGMRFFERSPEQAAALTQVAVTHLRSRGVAATGVVRASLRCDVARGIVDEAAATQASLILLGAPPRHRLAGLLRRNVVAQVLRRTACRVLVVRVDGTDGQRPGPRREMSAMRDGPPRAA